MSDTNSIMVTRALESMAREIRELRDDVRQGDALRPLDRVLQISPGAARMRLQRDEGLRRLGVKTGKRTLFKPADVIAYFRARGEDVEASK